MRRAMATCLVWSLWASPGGPRLQLRATGRCPAA